MSCLSTGFPLCQYEVAVSTPSLLLKVMLDDLIPPLMAGHHSLVASLAVPQTQVVVIVEVVVELHRVARSLH